MYIPSEINLFKIASALFLCTWIYTGLNGQNPIPNADFESYITCPADMSQIAAQADWFDATNGTADYFNACDPSGLVSVPQNFMGMQTAHSGNGYAGIHIAQNKGVAYREFIEAELLEPLVAGKAYVFNFYLNLGDHSFCAPTKICVYFSEQMITDFTTTANIPPSSEFIQSLCTTGNAEIKDSVNWQLIEFCFIATGNEKFVLIGNNFTNAFGGCTTDLASIQHAYIYIDDISISEPVASTAYFDTMLCKGEEITIDISGFIKQPANAMLSCTWNDGNIDINRTFFAVGEYEAILQNGCISDTVRITIHENPDCEEIFFIPNAFSPNGDGVNDKFKIVQNHITVTRFAIYNRWGQIVFSSTSSDGWDGSRNGVMQPMGVYLYQLDYTTDITDESKRKEGYITLIY